MSVFYLLGGCLFTVFALLCFFGAIPLSADEFREGALGFILLIYAGQLLDRAVAA